MNQMLKSGFEDAFGVKIKPVKLVSKLKPEIQKIWDFVNNLNESKLDSVEVSVEILEYIHNTPEFYHTHLEPIEKTSMSDLFLRVGLQEQLNIEVSLEVVRDFLKEITGFDVVQSGKKTELVLARNSFIYYCVDKLGYKKMELASFLNLTRTTIQRAYTLVEESSIIDGKKYEDILMKLNHKIETYKLENQ